MLITIVTVWMYTVHRMVVFVSFVLFLFCAIDPIRGWVAIIPYKEPSEFSGNKISESHCYSSEYGLYSMAPGEVKQLKTICGEARCATSRNIFLTGCGVVQVDPPCYVIPGNLSRPYPNCCYDIKCPPDTVVENKL